MYARAVTLITFKPIYNIMMIYRFSFLLCIVLLIFCKSDQDHTGDTDATPTAPDQLNWLSIHDLDKLDTRGKDILVDVYTDWCGYCKVMDRNTFTDPQVIKHLSEHYHVIKFNAEQKAPIYLNGHKYEWKPGGRRGYNQLAREMLDGRMSYPTMVYFDSDKQKIIAIPGYKKTDQLLSDIERVRQLE